MAGSEPRVPVVGLNRVGLRETIAPGSPGRMKICRTARKPTCHHVHMTRPVQIEQTEVDPAGVGAEVAAEDSPWQTIVWNDPVNLMSYVTYVFQKLFGYSREHATKLMLDVHHKRQGDRVIGVQGEDGGRRGEAARSRPVGDHGAPVVKTWQRKGAAVVATLDRQEAAVLRGLVSQINDMLMARVEETPQDELAELTGIRTGPSTSPDDPILSRLLPDFHRLDEDNPSKSDQDSAAALRSLHEPELLDLKTGVAGIVLETCPPGGGEVRLTLEQADAWLYAINDVRLALGTALDVTDDMPDELPEDDPRSSHLGVYHWLTWVQDTLVAAMAGDD